MLLEPCMHLHTVTIVYSLELTESTLLMLEQLGTLLLTSMPVGTRLPGSTRANNALKAWCVYLWTLGLLRRTELIIVTELLWV